MARTQQADLNVVLYFGGKLEKAYGVGYRRPFLAYPVGKHILGEAALVDESLIAQRKLNRVEILPLDILHDSHLEHALVICLPNVGGDDGHSGHAAGFITPFSADNLELAIRDAPYADRLDKAQGANRSG